MKTVLFSALFFFCTFVGFAQQSKSDDWKSQGRHQVSLAAGFAPLPWYGEKLVGGNNRRKDMHPVGFSIAYQYRAERLFDIGIVYGMTTKKEEQTYSKKRDTRHTGLLFGRFNYFQWKNGVLYGRIGGGIRVETSVHQLVDQKSREEEVKFAYQLSPIGVEVGRKLAGFAEFGYGSIGTAIVGVRYKF